MDNRPRIAIIETNTLAVLGLKQLLQEVIPIMAIDNYSSLAELEAHGTDQYVHYFVSMQIVLTHRPFFSERRRKTIVLTQSFNESSQLREFHSLCVNDSEARLVRQLLGLAQMGHAGGRNLPPAPDVMRRKHLTDREIEVLSFIVQGLRNKEVADKLSIEQTTVITHRKNIMRKLGLKSLSALTIYAVMHGYVDINKV